MSHLRGPCAHPRRAKERAIVDLSAIVSAGEVVEVRIELQNGDRLFLRIDDPQQLGRLAWAAGKASRLHYGKGERKEGAE